MPYMGSPEGAEEYRRERQRLIDKADAIKREEAEKRRRELERDFMICGVFDDLETLGDLDDLDSDDLDDLDDDLWEELEEISIHEIQYTKPKEEEIDNWCRVIE